MLLFLAIAMFVVPAMMVYFLPAKFRFVAGYFLFLALAVVMDGIIYASHELPADVDDALVPDSSLTPPVSIFAAIVGLIWIAVVCKVVAVLRCEKQTSKTGDTDGEQIFDSTVESS